MNGISVAPSQMKKNPTISIAMCTYQGAPFLPEQLESILAQAMPPDEVVICDDGSVDETPQILQDFCSRAPFPVRLTFNPDRLGPVRNFEQALSLCTGDYVLMADQDDVWQVDKTGQLVRAASQALAETQNQDLPLMVFSDLELVGPALRPLHPSFFRRMNFHRKMLAFPSLLIENVAPGCASLVNRRLLDIALPFPEADESIGMHDWWLSLCAAGAGTVLFLDERLVKYRQHAGNAIGTEGNSKRRSEAAPTEKVSKSERALRKIDRAIARAGCVYRRLTEHMPADRIVASAGAYARFATLPASRRLALMLRSPVRRRTARKTLMLALRMMKWSPTRRSSRDFDSD